MRSPLRTSGPPSPARYFLAGVLFTAFLVCISSPFLILNSCSNKLKAEGLILLGRQGGKAGTAGVTTAVSDKVLPRKALQDVVAVGVVAGGSSPAGATKGKSGVATGVATSPPLPPPPQQQQQGMKALLNTTVRLPYVVQRFREGAVTWDMLVPDRNHSETMGPYFAGTYFMLHDHGPLTDYTACSMLSAKCVVHASQQRCMDDNFCGWCADRAVCVDRHLAGPLELCQTEQLRVAEHPSDPPQRVIRISDSGTLQEGSGTSLAGCTSVVQGRFAAPALSNEQMYYHWLFDNWRVLYGSNDRLQHYLMDSSYRPDLFHYFGLLSDSCYRFVRDLPAGMCLVTWPNTKMTLHPALPGDQDAYTLARHRMGFYSEDPPKRPLVCVIQRSFKRFLLNAEELVTATRELGLSAEVAFLDELTFFEQLQLLRQCTVLVGLHGSGIANFVYLPKGAAVIEVIQLKSWTHAMPYYSRRVPERGLFYQKLEITDPADCVFHWDHYKADVTAPDARRRVVELGPTSDGDFWTFWVNMDARVQLDAYLDALRSAVNGAPLHADMGITI